MPPSSVWNTAADSLFDGTQKCCHDWHLLSHLRYQTKIFTPRFNALSKSLHIHRHKLTRSLCWYDDEPVPDLVCWWVRTSQSLWNSRESLSFFKFYNKSAKRHFRHLCFFSREALSLTSNNHHPPLWLKWYSRHTICSWKVVHMSQCAFVLCAIIWVMFCIN